MRLSKRYTTVTPFSRTLALLIFISFPIAGFFYGRYYQKALDVNNQQDIIIEYKLLTPTPTPPSIQSQQTILSCTTSKDCPAGYYCSRMGPVYYHAENTTPLTGLTCHKIGVAIPQ